MNATEREPSQDDLLAMAYADGELDGAERERFEQRLADSPSLALEVARYRRLQSLAQQAAPPEPMDYEWRRLAADPLQRLLLALGWALLVVAGGTLVLWGEYSIAVSDLPLVPKLALAGLLLGLVLLAAAALRARLRTRPLDPYTEVQR
jgi:anti-sigma factor RsiW